MSGKWAIGLMSGTSMDGIDVAAIRVDGRRVSITRGPNGAVELGPTGKELKYGPDEKALLIRAKEAAKTFGDRKARPAPLAEAESLVTARHAEAVEAFLRDQNLRPEDIGVVGFHGQTLVHRPGEGLTVQIGDGQALADRLGIPVVFDFRADDVAGGGEGAPLVPVFHQALAEACGFERPLAVLNIGGVANVTFIGEAGDLLAFDTGPGNALLDDLMRERSGGRLDVDQDGAAAASGRADPDLLAWLLKHPFFHRLPPKSLDRDQFSHRMVGPLGLADAAATLAAFTAGSAAGALRWTELRPHRWIVAGGGAKNPAIMAELGRALGPGIAVSPASEMGLDGDHLEAQAFAYLAVMTRAGEPITFPSTTGVTRPTVGGRLVTPR